MALELYHPGLRGVIAGETNIGRIDGGMQYRGYCIQDLAEEAGFLEVACLLLHEELPTEEVLADFRSILMEEADLPPQVMVLFEQLPLHVSPAEALRTGVSLLGHFDPQPHDEPAESGLCKARRLLARTPLLVAAWHRLRSGEPLLSPDPDLGFAANLYYLLTGRRAAPPAERALNAALVVSAEHEFNPSTYVARIAGSTQADLYSAVTAAIATFMGDRHGGGDDRVLQVLRDAKASGDVSGWVRMRLQEPQPLAGFGHPVYRDCDPRASILEQHCSDLARSCGRGSLENIADAVERAVWEEARRPPNLDWPLARLLYYLGLPADLHLPVFMCARMAGWCAHAIEQSESGQLIRPRARYRGAEDLPFVPLCDRE